MRKYFILIFWFWISIVMMGCFKEDDYDMVKAADLVSFDLDTAKHIEGNGSSFSLVKISISDKAIPSRRNVTLKTDLGSFVGGKGDSIVVMANESFQAEARLVSTKAGKATLTAIIAGLREQSEGKLTFLKAFPDKITVSVDSFSISSSYKSEVNITASLGSGSGVPSSKYPVNFSVLNPSGQVVGVFLNGINSSETDASGKATIRYSAGNSGFFGRLTIFAETKKVDGTVISGQTYIQLTP